MPIAKTVKTGLKRGRKGKGRRTEVFYFGQQKPLQLLLLLVYLLMS